MISRGTKVTNRHRLVSFLVRSRRLSESVVWLNVFWGWGGAGGWLKFVQSSVHCFHPYFFSVLWKRRRRCISWRQTPSGWWMGTCCSRFYGDRRCRCDGEGPQWDVCVGGEGGGLVTDSCDWFMLLRQCGVVLCGHVTTATGTDGNVLTVTLV